jgi:hypothetical protein
LLAEQPADTQRSQPSTDANNQHPPNNKRRPLVVGKAMVQSRNSSTRGCGITAAKSLVKKAVFCVDNVGLSYTVNDVRNFVADMSVNVLSCFEVQSRRRGRNLNSLYPTEPDRKAFRLCIDSADRERMLDPSKWPAYVSVYDWHFKPKETTGVK